jgi:hypothetical protein
MAVVAVGLAVRRSPQLGLLGRNDDESSLYRSAFYASDLSEVSLKAVKVINLETSLDAILIETSLDVIVTTLSELAVIVKISKEGIQGNAKPSQSKPITY